MPEGRLYNFRRKPVNIMEIRNHGYDRFLTNERPSYNGGIVFDDRRTGYHFGGGTMTDNFDKPRKPKIQGSNMNIDNRTMRYSTRF